MSPDPPWITPGLLLGLLALAMTGDGLFRCLRDALLPRAASGDQVSWPEQVGLRVLLALAAVPWLCMVMDPVRLPINRGSLLVGGVLILAAGIAIDRRRRRPAGAPPAVSSSGGAASSAAAGARAARHEGEGAASNAKDGAALLRSPAALVLALLSASLVPFSLIHVSLIPVRSYDALVGYDLVGKIMAREGRMVSSVFHRLSYNAQCVYAPFTATNNGYWYIWNPTIPRLWVPLLAGGFLLVFWARVRRWTSSPTAASLASFVLFLPTSFLYQLTVAQTDLPSMAFTALALFALIDLLRGEGGYAPVALWLLVAATARTENVLFGVAFTLVAFLGPFLRLAPKPLPHVGRSLWFTCLPAAFFAWWNLVVVKLQMGYNPARHFLREIPVDPARAREVVSRAVGIIFTRADFGELGWLVILVPLLWAASRWLERSRRLDPKVDPRLAGPLLVCLGAMFLFYMPYFYMWDPVYNPLWTMEHTFKRGFFRFVPGVVTALVSVPPVLLLLRKCDGRR